MLRLKILLCCRSASSLAAIGVLGLWVLCCGSWRTWERRRIDCIRIMERDGINTPTSLASIFDEVAKETGIDDVVDPSVRAQGECQQKVDTANKVEKAKQVNADHRQNLLNSPPQHETATSMFNSTNGTPSFLTDTAIFDNKDQSLAGKIPRHGVTVGTTNSGTGTDGGDTGKWRGGIEYGTFSGV